MVGSVAIISKNNLRIQQMRSYCAKLKCNVYVCSEIADFVKIFNNINIGCYVLDVQTNGEVVPEFEIFYKAFLKHIPSEQCIVIHEQSNDGNYIPYKNFEYAFYQKYEAQVLNFHSLKMLTKEEICNLTKQIERYLLEKNFNPKYYGFDYVVYILRCYLTNRQKHITLVKDVYPQLSEEINSPIYRIERNVRFFLQSNEFIHQLIPDNKISTKRVLELLYRDIKKDVYIQRILNVD